MKTHCQAVHAKVVGEQRAKILALYEVWDVGVDLLAERYSVDDATISRLIKQARRERQVSVDTSSRV